MGAGALRVFLSHTSELAKYPVDRSYVAAAAAGVLRLGGMPVDMADFGARDEVAEETCRREVVRCDAYVGVIGFRYGSPVRGRTDGLSYTELEFLVAGDLGLPRLVFVLDETSAAVPSQLIDEDRSQIDGFRARVQAEVTTMPVTNADRLEAAVSQALVRLVGHPGIGPARAPSRVWMVPPRMGTVVERPDLADRIVDSVVASSPSRVGISIGVEGAGGFGKTTLVSEVARRPEIARSFPGGVLWATVGPDTAGPALAGVMGRLIHTLDRDVVTPADVAEAGDLLGELLDSRPATLLVVDDVWRAEQLAPFLAGSAAGCRRLVTTRNRGVVPPGSVSITVDEMTPEQSRATLTDGLPQSLSAVLLERLVRLTGRWPVLLGLVNAIVVDKVSDGATVDQAALWIAEQISQAGPAIVDDYSRRDRAVGATMAASMSLFDAAERERYLDLTIFEEGAVVPDRVLALVWQATGGLDGAAARRLRERIGRLRLALTGWHDGPTLRLHDVIRTYLRAHVQDHDQQVEGGLAGRNGAAVDAARSLLPGRDRVGAATEWWLLPPEEGYWWTHIGHHLQEAGRFDDLAELVCDLRWVEATTRRTGSTSQAEADLDRVDTPISRAVCRAVRRASYLLGPIDPPTALGATLASRVDQDPASAGVAADYRATLPAPRLDPAWPLPDIPHPALTRILTGHFDRVSTVEFSPDGKLLASGDGAGVVRIWDVMTGTARAELTGDAGAVAAIRFSPDGRLLASGSSDRQVRVWSVGADRAPVWLTGHTDRVAAIKFSPDGKLLASADGGGAVRIWEVATGTVQAELTGHSRAVNALDFSPDGILLAAGCADGAVRIWVVTRGSAAAELTGYTDRVSSVAFRSDGKLLASGCANGAVRIWDVATGAMRAEFTGHHDCVTALGFSPDGTLLASSESFRVRIWDVTTGAARAELTGHADPVNSVGFSPDGKLLASGSGDRSVRIWNVGPDTARAELVGHTGWVNSVGFSPDGKLLASGGGDRMASGSGDRSIRVWDVATGKVLAELSGHTGGVWSLGFSPDGELLVSGGGDGSVRTWEVASGRMRAQLAGHTGLVSSVSFSPDATLVASGVGNRSVRIWNVATDTLCIELAGHTGWVSSLGFSPDATLLASAGDDGSVRIWEIATGRLRAELAGHTGRVRTVRFSPDGMLLASGDGDGSVRVWDVATVRTTCALRVGGPLDALAWHPRQQKLALAGLGGAYLLSYQR